MVLLRNLSPEMCRRDVSRYEENKSNDEFVLEIPKFKLQVAKCSS